MKNLFCISLFTLVAITTLNAQNNIQLKDVVEGKYTPKSLNAIIPLLGGEHYAIKSNDNKAILQYSYKTGRVTDTLFYTGKARECNFKTFDGFSFSDDQKKILIYTDKEPINRRSFRANYYTFEIKRNLVKPLSENGKQQIATFSPNGRMVAFVRDNNIYLKKLDYETESAVTKDGAKMKISNGAPTWVYEEEFETVSSLAWSPNNETLAYIRYDESSVPVYDIEYYEGMCPSLDKYAMYPGAVSYKYPVSGVKNDNVAVYTYTVENRVLKKMQFPIEEDFYIPRIQFTKNPEQLAIATLNRNQNLLRIYAANPKSGVSKLLFQEESEKWYDAKNLYFLTFYPDAFVIGSSKSGYSQLYLYNANGRLVRPLTQGKWDVTDFYGYDPISGNCYFQAAKESPMTREVYRSDSKSVLYPIATQKGTNSAQFSDNFNYAILNYNNANVPAQISIIEKNGKSVRSIEKNEGVKKLLAGVKYSPKEFFTFTNNSSVQLNGYMVKPANFDNTKKYPVVLTQYSGPGSQRVLDRFEFGWEQFLASQGYIVVCVDGRGTGGRGIEFMQSIYLKLGVLESEDQLAAAKFMAKYPYVDASKIGIMGWSYGGFNTLMSLTGNRDIKVGVAIAPVTDWRFYDSIYTERYMRTPQQNKEGYDHSSPLMRAADMNGKLLIVSGSADDNVHLQNTMQYSEALVQADKQFDMQIYTNRNHSISGCNTRNHMYTKILNFLNLNLK